MCGIVGLFLKTPALEPHLGALMAGMLSVMKDRGPDSAGFAIYRAPVPGQVKLTLRISAPGAAALAEDYQSRFAEAPTWTAHDSHLVMSVPAARETEVRAWLAARPGDVHIVGVGKRMEIYKEVGAPPDVARRFGLAEMSGSHAIGHTRMATESRVTTDGAHPFSTGRDQCLVHNGSLSNHNAVRRELRREGLTFETDNDSEVAAAYLTWRMGQGASLQDALAASLRDLDGFYTFVVGNETGFAVVRDPIACKPAIMAETDDYVAFGSEYRALVALPGVKSARVFEPEPARIYAWERAA